MTDVSIKKSAGVLEQVSEGADAAWAESYLRDEVLPYWFDRAQSVTADRLRPGKSGAQVYLIRARDLGVDEIPRVVKIGPTEEILEEEARYQKYVANKLRFSPALVRSHSCGQVSAIEYLAVGRGGEIDSLSTLLPEWTPMNAYKLYQVESTPLALMDSVWGVMHNLFSHALSPWYGATTGHGASLPGKPSTMSEEYAFDDADAIVTEYEVARGSCTGSQYSPTDVFRILSAGFGAVGERYLRSLIHGDLHGGNILIELWHVTRHFIMGMQPRLFPEPDTRIDPRAHLFPWLIDFGHTGWGHTFRDFAKLERDLKFKIHTLSREDAAQVEDWLGTAELGAVITMKEPPGEPEIWHRPHRHACYRACYLVRAYADAACKEDKQRSVEYLAALLFQTLLLFTSPAEDYSEQRVAIVESIERICRCLSSLLRL